MPHQRERVYETGKLTGRANAWAAWLPVKDRENELPASLLLLLLLCSEALHHCCWGSHPDTAPSSAAQKIAAQEWPEARRVISKA